MFALIQTRFIIIIIIIITIIIINKCEIFIYIQPIKIFINSFSIIDNITIKSFNQSQN